MNTELTRESNPEEAKTEFCKELSELQDITKSLRYKAHSSIDHSIQKAAGQKEFDSYPGDLLDCYLTDTKENETLLTVYTLGGKNPESLDGSRMYETSYVHHTSQGFTSGQISKTVLDSLGRIVSYTYTDPVHEITRNDKFYYAGNNMRPEKEEWNHQSEHSSIFSTNTFEYNKRGLMTRNNHTESTCYNSNPKPAQLYTSTVNIEYYHNSNTMKSRTVNALSVGDDKKLDNITRTTYDKNENITSCETIETFTDKYLHEDVSRTMIINNYNKDGQCVSEVTIVGPDSKHDVPVASNIFVSPVNKNRKHVVELTMNSNGDIVSGFTRNYDSEGMIKEQVNLITNQIKTITYTENRNTYETSMPCGASKILKQSVSDVNGIHTWESKKVLKDGESMRINGSALMNPDYECAKRFKVGNTEYLKRCCVMNKRGERSITYETTEGSYSEKYQVSYCMRNNAVEISSITEYETYECYESVTHWTNDLGDAYKYACHKSQVKFSESM